jgi:hypothetical protein
MPDEEMAEAYAEFEVWLGQYIDRWGEAVRQHIQSLEAAPAKKTRKARRSRPRKKGKGHV